MPDEKPPEKPRPRPTGDQLEFIKKKILSFDQLKQEQQGPKSPRSTTSGNARDVSTAVFPALPPLERPSNQDQMEFIREKIVNFDHLRHEKMEHKSSFSMDNLNSSLESIEIPPVEVLRDPAKKKVHP